MIVLGKGMELLENLSGEVQPLLLKEFGHILMMKKWTKLWSEESSI